MRSHTTAVAVALLAAGIFAASASAQSVPSPDQIIKSLTPTGPSGATRGIRLQPATGNGGATAGRPSAPRQAPAISLNVQFTTGSAELTPEATRVLENLGKALSDQTLAGYRFRIEGHTDTVGTHPYNKELSDRRAATVVDYLATNFQVDRSRMEAIGMGEDGLLVPTPDQTPEQRNRRVQVVNVGS
jgi:outer membrane protein OmpA-like peptidoglycan-associated protein